MIEYLHELHEAIAAVCPIDGVSGDINDPDTWEIQFSEDATEAEIENAYDKLNELKESQQ